MRQVTINIEATITDEVNTQQLKDRIKRHMQDIANKDREDEGIKEILSVNFGSDAAISPFVGVREDLLFEASEHFRKQLRPIAADDAEYFKVEYHPDYWGGDYSDTGHDVFLAFAHLEQLAKLVPLMADDDDLLVKLLFKVITNEDPVHIIHYTMDEVYDANENLIES